MPQPKERKTRGRRGSSSVPSQPATGSRPRQPNGNSRTANGRQRFSGPLNVSAARRRLGVNPRTDVHSGRVRRGGEDAATSRFNPNMSAQENLMIIQEFLSDCERNLAESHVQREQLAQMAAQVMPLPVELARNQFDMFGAAGPLDPGSAAPAQANIPFRRANFGEDNLGERELVAGPEPNLCSHIDSTNTRRQMAEEADSSGCNGDGVHVLPIGSVQVDRSPDNNFIAFILEINEDQTEDPDAPPAPDDNAQD